VIATQSKLRRVKAIRVRSAFSMTELLVALVINALLLAALASAMSAATGSIENNDRYNRAVQETRIALDQLTKEIRCAASVGTITLSTNSTSGWSIQIVDDGSSTGNSGFGSDTRTWTYVPPSCSTPGYISVTDNTLNTTGYIGSTSSTSGISITGSTLSDAVGGGNAANGTAVSGITIKVTLQIGDNIVTLDGSASPRCNLLMQ
jgi:Tfp pilus assembly protein PilW